MEYFDYIVQHRRNVQLAFLKYGRILCKKLNLNYDELKNIIENHDLSKFGDEEYDYYRQYHMPNEDEQPNKDLLNLGILHHYNHNKHHPEYWIMVNDKGTTVLDMDDYSIAEMLLDWEAVNIYYHGNTYNWYKKDGKNKTYSKNTLNKIEKLINIFK